ncbi:hypothetical protein MUK42_25239 [Musa troglodytarum]|uniref:Uncharacterized protein n=1 Tax=Musa troglodytarum TaxID=320322 RepID=A0A9E7EAV0_9LILI|nr:hypothetical protein MUK42_25239 [Musa troglodytarum]
MVGFLHVIYGTQGSAAYKCTHFDFSLASASAPSLRFYEFLRRSMASRSLLLLGIPKSSRRGSFERSNFVGSPASGPVPGDFEIDGVGLQAEGVGVRRANRQAVASSASKSRHEVSVRDRAREGRRERRQGWLREAERRREAGSLEVECGHLCEFGVGGEADGGKRGGVGFFQCGRIKNLKSTRRRNQQLGLIPPHSSASAMLLVRSSGMDYLWNSQIQNSIP